MAPKRKYQRKASTSTKKSKGKEIIVSNKKAEEEEKKEENPSKDCRDWLRLPDVLLITIIDCLMSIPDFISISSVSTNLNHLAASSIFKRSLTSFAPLLFSPILRPPPNKSKEPRSLWTFPPRCIVQEITGSTNFYKSKLHKNTLWKACIGYSFGHLIFIQDGRITINNVCTGAEIVAPQLPEKYMYELFSISILTAPVKSSSCVLVLVTFANTLVWRLSKCYWVIHKLLRYHREIMCLGPFQDKIFCLAKNFNLKAIEFEPHTTWTTLEVKMHVRPSIVTGKYQSYLVECRGDLILVLFAERVWHKIGIDLYRLDLSKGLWVKIDSLGDACLFIDAIGNVPIVCLNPSRWGGRSNCAYIAGPGCDTWTVFKLDGSDIYTIFEESALGSKHGRLSRWPSPVWVYPSMLF